MRGSRAKLRAAVFDMDGTLIDSSAVIPAAYIAAIEALGGPAYTPRQIIDVYPVGPPRAMLTELLGRPCTDEEIDGYHKRLEAAAGGTTVYPGIHEALRELGASVQLAVFTGASIRACRILLGKAGLVEHFGALVGADEVAHPKPAPDGIHLACERLGVTPSDAAYVGDSPNDLEAARRSGALAVAAAWGDLFRPGEPADAVLTRPAELLDLLGSPDR
jgi:HAD superfamily hydrolase (TIGR01509 family)